MSASQRAIRSAAAQGDEILLHHQLQALGTRMGYLEAATDRVVVQSAEVRAELRRVADCLVQIEAKVDRVLRALGEEP